LENVPTLEEQIDNGQMPEGHLATELHLYDEENPGISAVLSVSTNNEEIFAQLTATNFKAELITLSQVENLAGSNVEDIDRIDENFDESLLNTDEHFFSMKILDESIDEGESIRYTFGDELLAVLKRYKAQTHIQVSPEEDNSAGSRYDVWNNAFQANGDGGSIVTKLNVRYSYSCSGSFYGKDTQGGFLNYYRFRSCKWPWNSSTRNRYSYFTVIQDVLKSHYSYRVYECETC